MMATSTLSRTMFWLMTGLACPLLLGCGWLDLGGDQEVGRPCDPGIAAGPNQGVYATGASECPSKLCLKPVVQPGAAGNVDTAPYCSGECSDDSDCGGEVRDKTDPADTRCRQGFTCGMAFSKGPLCCKKLCLCKDFLGPAGAPTPIACQGDGGKYCADGTGDPLMSGTVGVGEVTESYVDVTPVRQLDLVTVIDNSPGMAPKIDKLRAQFGKLIDTLKDPVDGTLPDLRVAIIDSDLGTRGAYTNNACAVKDLPDGLQSAFGDLGRFQMLSSPTPCSFTLGARFLEHKSGLPLNYTGDLATVFSCLAGNLGTAGCFEESPLQAFEFGLVAQGVGNETQQLTFLRSTAHLGLVFLSDEDDCSAAPNDGLFGDFQELRGESPSLRCATRAHKCNGQDLASSTPGYPGYPTRSPFSAAFSACQARMGDECNELGDTSKPTTCNPLRSIATLALELMALKPNPDQITVAGIFGWPLSEAEMATAQYTIAPIPNPNPADVQHPTVFDYWPVCYDPNHLPSPATTDPGTGFDATAAAWGATGGLREAAFVDQFGANGMKFSICQPDFANTMTTIGSTLASKLRNVCLDRKLVDADLIRPGVQADCRVVWRIAEVAPGNPTSVVYKESATSLPQCLEGATDGTVPMDCWQLLSDPLQCPASGQRIAVLRTAQEKLNQPQIPPGTKLGMQCRTCPPESTAYPSDAGCAY